jgi:hypothetical protein
MPTPYSGRCLCGSVQFVITSEPAAVMSCYCEHCSKGAGGTNQIVRLPSRRLDRGSTADGLPRLPSLPTKMFESQLKMGASETTSSPKPPAALQKPSPSVERVAVPCGLCHNRPRGSFSLSERLSLTEGMSSKSPCQHQRAKEGQA